MQAPVSETARPIAVEVSDLVTYYGRRKILDGIDLTVAEGEICTIMGGSGSGKTTLLRYLLGLGTPARGTIRILGTEIGSANSAEMFALRKRIGVSFQSGALLTSMSVAENIKLPLREHTNLDESTMNIMARMKLEFVNMGGSEHLMPAQLSGGMVKRAALARAIIMDPKLLFFDEPSAGLDPVVAAELDELILRLRDTLQMTIVVVTHELVSAFKIADTMTVIDAGKVLVSGSLEKVRQCDDPRVQGLLNRRPRVERLDAEAYVRRLIGD